MSSQFRRQPKVAVLVFPGSNDDRDAAWALGALGADAVVVRSGEDEHRDPRPPLGLRRDHHACTSIS